MIRLVLHPDEHHNGRYYEAWTDAVSRWLGAGHRVYMMVHCPNNLHCPAQAARFQSLLAGKSDQVQTLPDWPLPQSSLF